jgi:aspartate/methionine/tyrosine aminotransferase
MDIDRLLAPRTRTLQTSGIRRVFDLGATLKDPINLSIGQPEFPVPPAIRRAAIDAIEAGENGYTLTTGIPSLRHKIAHRIVSDLGWPADTGEPGSSVAVMVTTGTSAALLLSMLALLGEGDEIIVPDPYFVAYPNMPILAGGKAVLCDTYPDFRMTAARIEKCITARTKAVLIDSPSNPCGVVLTSAECRDILDLCRAKGVVLLSDEIYDEFCFAHAREQSADGRMVNPSPGRFPGAHEDVLVIRGFGKTYGCTGWRLGYVAGPARLVQEIAKLAQYSYVCAPTPLQRGAEAAFGVDMTETVARYAKRAAMVCDRLGAVTRVVRPGGAFYVFAEAGGKAGLTGQQLFEKAVERNVLTIPGNVFSARDSHIRISIAATDDRLERGVGVLADILAGR